VYLPSNYGGLEDPVRFFTELGEQAAAEADRTERLTYAIRTTLTWAGIGSYLCS
jgi:hypothetical protein